MVGACQVQVCTAVHISLNSASVQRGEEGVSSCVPSRDGGTYHWTERNGSVADKLVLSKYAVAFLWFSGHQVSCVEWSCVFFAELVANFQ